MTKRELKEMYHSKEYQKIRNDLIQVDKFCINCGEPSIVVHHVYSTRYYPEHFFDEVFLETMCRSCHGLYHWYLRFGESNPEKFEKWLYLQGATGTIR